MASNCKQSSIQVITECSICMGSFEKPKALPCQHTFCEGCLINCSRATGGHLRCPMCNCEYGKISIAQLPNNYTMLSLLELSNDCTCIETGRANLFCTECFQVSCDSCLQEKHKDHTFQDLRVIEEHCLLLDKQIQEEKTKMHHMKKQLGDVLAIEKVEKCREKWMFAINKICDASITEIKSVTKDSQAALVQRKKEMSAMEKKYSEAKSAISVIRSPLQQEKKRLWTQIETMMETDFIENNCVQYSVEFKHYDTVVDSSLQTAGDVSFCQSIDVSKSEIECVRYERSSKKATVKLDIRDINGEGLLGGNLSLKVIKPGGNLLQNEKLPTPNEYRFWPKSNGTYTIHVSVNGKKFKNSPKTLLIEAPLEQTGFKFGQEKYYGAHDVAVFKNEMFVTDKYNRQIVVIDKNGRLLRRFDINEKHMDVLFGPFGIAVTETGLLYISDMNNHEIFVCDVFGNVQQRIGKSKLVKPNGVAFTKDKELLVVDYDQCCLNLFTNDGRFKKKFGGPGKGNGMFLQPWFVAINSKGYWIVSDSGNRRFQILDATGKFMKSVSVGYQVRGVVVDPEDKIIISVVIDGSWLKKNYKHAIMMYHSDGHSYGNISKQNCLLRPRGMCIIEDGRGEKLLIVTDDSDALHRYEMI